MDELGAAFGRIAELVRRQRVDPPAASLARLEQDDALAGARQLAGGHEAGGSRADDDEIAAIARSHGLVPASANPGSAVPEAITEPDRAILEHSAALQRHCLDGRRQPPLRLARVEDAGRAPGAVDG